MSAGLEDQDYQTHRMEVYRTDWLASNPVFYNEKTGQISHSFNDVVDFRNLELDAEGLNNYLDVGYSVFGQTPVKHVKFLRHSASIRKGASGMIEIDHSEDPVKDAVGVSSSEDHVFELLKQKIESWENSFEGAIVIPSSGGYDSRLLNLLVKDKSRIHSFTYGVSDDQSRSSEVVFAKKMSEILGTKWEQIPLGHYHQYLDQWDELYGASTHAHGMYHFEFYAEIRKKLPSAVGLLSGVIGDAWAGNVNIPPITKPTDVYSLGYSHNLNADSKYCRLKSDSELLNNYYHQNKLKLEDPGFRIIESMRMKILLLSYLLKVPDSMHFKTWSPFLDMRIALSMLNIDPQRRLNRKWQADMFRRNGLNLEEMNLPATNLNSLDMQGLKNRPPDLLNEEILKEVFLPAYIQEINRNLRMNNGVSKLRNRLLGMRGFRYGLRQLGIVNKNQLAYNAYLTLRPIQRLLEKRNQS